MQVSPSVNSVATNPRSDWVYPNAIVYYIFDQSCALLLDDLATIANASAPDIVIVVVDDLGYSDFGCYGSEIQTPNIDRLADHGIRFSQFVSENKCNPSRTSLMTGQYYIRGYHGSNTLTIPEGAESGRLPVLCQW